MKRPFRFIDLSVFKSRKLARDPVSLMQLAKGTTPDVKAVLTSSFIKADIRIKAFL